VPLTLTGRSGMQSGLTKRQYAEKLRVSLKLDYDNGWRSHHQEISDYIQPRRARFLLTDAKTAGTKKNDRIINNAATEASDTLRAGITSGTCSSSRPWFKLTTHEPTLAEDGGVKEWLHEAERITQGVLSKSNFYLRIEEFYGDLGDFGTAVMHIEPDDTGDEVIRCYVHPIGSYYLAQSARLEVDTLFRDVPMTVAQLAAKFTIEKCCQSVKDAWALGSLFQTFDVVHFIMPNEAYEEGVIGWQGKKWLSGWYELARREDEGEGHSKGLLNLSGYDYRPFMAARWKVTGTDVYGSSPGMNALGDVKGLQHIEEQKMGLLDKQVNPPMNVPPMMRNQQASLLPGAENPVAGQGQKMEPALTIHPQAVQHALEAIQRHENRIRVSYHADLFRLLEAMDKGQMTAFEVRERIAEKMQLIGPAYERTEEELLDPAMDAILHILFESFWLPPAPEELAGQDLKVEYQSIVAQALKATGTGAIRELLQLAGNMVAVFPDVLDNIDEDRLIQEYAQMLAISPKALREPKVVAAIRAAKAKQAQQQQAMEQAAVVTQGAKTLSETDTEGPNALTALLGNSGRGPPQQ
jgi:hypothetical protein